MDAGSSKESRDLEDVNIVITGESLRADEHSK